MTRKYIPIDGQEPESKKKKKKKIRFQDETFDEILAKFNQKVLENRKKKPQNIIPARQTNGYINIIPDIEKYSFPMLTDEEKKRYDELKKIVLSTNKKVQKNEINEGDIEKKYRELLNDAQCEAVFNLEGPQLVIAGAGSGKTRTIVHRVAYMLEKEIRPESILLLTFTRRAANEMRSRVQRITGHDSVNRITAGTFHSFANLMLRIHGHFLGIDRNFTICDQVDSADIIDLIKNELKLPKRSKPFPKKTTVAEIISRSRNTERPIGEVVDAQYSKYLDFAMDIAKIAERYSTFKKEKNVLDYDDLLEVFLKGLQDSPQMLERIQSKYRYIMVDEFQDTNLAQGRIANLLAAKTKNIMVVGDDLQSIYAFRGANFENILRFPENWPDCKVTRLEQNYRSRKELLDLTNSIVKNCYAAYNKELFSDLADGLVPTVKRTATAEYEASYIVDIIEESLERIPPGEISVLYRSSHHGNFVQAELLKRGIDFTVYGGIKFIERRHIKDILSYARIVQNPLDAVAMNRVLKLIDGIGSKTAGNIVELISKKGFEALKLFEKKKFFTQLKEVFGTIFQAGQPDLSPLETIEIICRHYTPILKEIESDYDDRLKDISVLKQIASGYRKLERFLTDFSLDPPSSQLSSGDVTDPEELNETVTLSTIHSAKGLEWHTVFVVHLLEHFFPSEKALSKIDNLEEERRLFYVACSRAKERLFLTFPAAVSFYNGILSTPSRFIAEIDRNLYEIKD